MPVALSRMRNMKGRSTVTGMGSLPGPESIITTPVAAAASVPLSSTDTNALWMTAEMCSPRVPVMPEKSAPGPKASGIPIPARVSPRLNSDSNSNNGIVRVMWSISMSSRIRSSASEFRESSNSRNLPSSGSRIVMDISPRE